MQYYRLTKTTEWVTPSVVMMVLLTTLSSLSMAAPPASASKAQLQQIDNLAKPTAKNHAQRQQKIETSIEQSDKKTAATDKKMHDFLERSDQGQQARKGASATTNQTTTPAAKNNHSGKQENGTKKGTDTDKNPATIKIECDGGIYFDNENGILTYLKNIRLNQSNGTFKLRCDDELKILFNSEPKDKGQDKSAEKADQKQTQQSSNSFSGRGDLKEIIATGNVKITGKNSDNQTFLAAGNTASYNAIAGEMILKGGRPILQQSANEYLQAAEDGQWIRLIMKDKDIESIITSQGKWVMQAVPQK
jgi:hypothetical protein